MKKILITLIISSLIACSGSDDNYIIDIPADNGDSTSATSDSSSKDESTDNSITDAKAVRGKMISTGSSYGIKADNGISYSLKFDSEMTFGGINNAFVTVEGIITENSGSESWPYEVQVTSIRIMENGYSTKYYRADGKITEADGEFKFTGDKEYQLDSFSASDWEKVDISKDVFILGEITEDGKLEVKMLYNSDLFSEDYDNSIASSSNIVSF